MSNRILSVRSHVDGIPIIVDPPEVRLVGRTVVKWSGVCGFFNMHTPNFFGLELAESKSYPSEWLLLRLWDACDWLVVNNRWLVANHDQCDANHRPLSCNCDGEQWDEFLPLISGKRIIKYDVQYHACEIVAGDATIRLTEDAGTRPVYAGTHQPRKLMCGDDLRVAWIISPKPYVHL